MFPFHRLLSTKSEGSNTVLSPFMLLLALCLPCGPLVAQTFQPVPTPLHVQEVQFNLANECYLHFQNPSGDSLRLRWRRLEVGMPEDWIVDLCDYGSCYIGIPPNAVMNIVYDTTRPYLKLIVQPGIRAGTAWLWFRVFELNNESNFQDVYFSLYTPGTTAITESPAQKSVHIYPNPTNEALFIEHRQPFETPARLFDTQGRILWEGVLPANGTSRLSSSTFPNGLYYLQVGERSHKVLVQK